jgi:hypothetical protein
MPAIDRAGPVGYSGAQVQIQRRRDGGGFAEIVIPVHKRSELLQVVDGQRLSGFWRAMLFSHVIPQFWGIYQSCHVRVSQGFCRSFGEFTTMGISQFTFGPVSFAVQSPISLFRNGELVAYWEEGKWPEPGFYDIMNCGVRRCEIVSDKLLVFEFENGLQMHLEDNSEYESMQIAIKGDPNTWIV